MKISVNDKELYTLTDMQCKVICNEISDEIFEEDMKRRLQWVLMHKYENCFDTLKKEWLPKLADRMDSVPTNPDKFAELVFSQEDYLCRKQRDELTSMEHINVEHTSVEAAKIGA